jgi:hypothetical protein
MTTALIVGELLTGLGFAAAAILAMFVGSALALGYAMTMDTEQRTRDA